MALVSSVIGNAAYPHPFVFSSSNLLIEYLNINMSKKSYPTCLSSLGRCYLNIYLIFCRTV